MRANVEKIPAVGTQSPSGGYSQIPARLLAFRPQRCIVAAVDAFGYKELREQEQSVQNNRGVSSIFLIFFERLFTEIETFSMDFRKRTLGGSDPYNLRHPAGCLFYFIKGEASP